MDRIDREILAHLQHDARISNKELAAKVGLAPSSCLARVRRLQRSGAILGYHAEVDPRVYGVTLEALVAVPTLVYAWMLVPPGVVPIAHS